MTTAASPASILLNASVLVFLFRALAGVRDSGRRQQVAQQLLGLLGDFVPFGAGRVILATSPDELEPVFLTAAQDLADRPVALWEHLTAEGPYDRDGLVAVPIYSSGALCGALLLRDTPPDAMATLSAVASLASVAIDSVREVETLRDERAVLEQRLFGNGGIIGHSAVVRKLLERVEKLAPRETTVLIQGESGTGKELVARLLHRGSPRADAPFVAINCAAIADALLESELFGHEKGAFTGAGSLKKGKLEMAEGGTLFLDEIGDLALPLQAKLLRVLQEREFERVGATKAVRVNLRVVAATNRDLAKASREGGFRLDLYHRLNVVTLQTPPLRERVEDIPDLAAHFLLRFGGNAKRLSPEALRCLQTYAWPGNVRELENAMEQAVVLGDGDFVLPTDLPECLWESASRDELGAFQSTVTDAKRESILRAYQQAGGDYKGAAKLLGLHPNYLLRLVRNLGLREALKK